ncbi:hypothetical protein VTK26DRAFT_9283 [Humicola hyalothermophila]
MNRVRLAQASANAHPAMNRSVSTQSLPNAPPRQFGFPTVSQQQSRSQTFPVTSATPILDSQPTVAVLGSPLHISRSTQQVRPSSLPQDAPSIGPNISCVSPVVPMLSCSPPQNILVPNVRHVGSTQSSGPPPRPRSTTASRPTPTARSTPAPRSTPTGRSTPLERPTPTQIPSTAQRPTSDRARRIFERILAEQRAPGTMYPPSAPPLFQLLSRIQNQHQSPNQNRNQKPDQNQKPNQSLNRIQPGPQPGFYLPPGQSILGVRPITTATTAATTTTTTTTTITTTTTRGTSSMPAPVPASALVFPPYFAPGPGPALSPRLSPAPAPGPSPSPVPAPAERPVSQQGGRYHAPTVRQLLEEFGMSVPEQPMSTLPELDAASAPAPMGLGAASEIRMEMGMGMGDQAAFWGTGMGMGMGMGMGTGTGTGGQLGALGQGRGDPVAFLGTGTGTEGGLGGLGQGLGYDGNGGGI